MARPPKERLVEQLPTVTYYKPVGVPLHGVEDVVLTVEEMEAVRLVDIEQLDQASAAAPLRFLRAGSPAGGRDIRRIL